MPSKRQPFQWLRDVAASSPFPGGGNPGNDYNNTLPPGATDVLPGPAYPGGNLSGEPTVIVNQPQLPMSSIPDATPFIPPEWVMPDGNGYPGSSTTGNSYPNLYNAEPVMVDGTGPGMDDGIPKPTPFEPPPWVMPSGGVSGRGFTGPYGGGNNFGQGVGDFGIDPRGNYGQQSWSPGAYSQAMLSLGIDPGAMMYRGHLQQ